MLLPLTMSMGFMLDVLAPGYFGIYLDFACVLDSIG